MSGMAHFFMSVGGSKFHERLAHFFIDIYIHALRTFVRQNLLCYNEASKGGFYYEIII